MDKDENIPFLNNIEESQNISQQSLEAKTELPENVRKELFLQRTAELFLKLETQFMIPATTIQYLMEEMQNIEIQNFETLDNVLRETLLNENIATSKIEAIINRVKTEHASLSNCTPLKTNYKRKQFYQKHFTYVKPVQKLLCSSNGKKHYFYYVPIRETVKAMFKDKSFPHIPLTSKSSNDNILRDFTDGSVYQSNTFFQTNL